MIAAVRPRRTMPTSQTSKETVLVAWLLLGAFGAHRFVLGHVAVGGLYAAAGFVTCGLSWLVGYLDGFLLLLGTPRDKHGLAVVWSWQRGKLTVDPLEEGTYQPAESIVRIVAHVGLAVVLPYAVMVGGFALFETSQVQETADRFALLATAVLGPLLAIQLIGGVRKARTQIALLRASHALTRRTRLDAIARAVALVTLRGALVLVTGLAMLMLSLAYRWASLGMLAILALSLFYLVTALASLYSSFVVRKFSSSLLQRGAVIQRRYEPPVARSGDVVRDTLDVKGVPVPPGFFLTVHGKLAPRLATEVRHVVAAKSRDERVELSTHLMRTPRGTYDAAPLRVAFTDLLGITSSNVASLATARIRILPAVRPTEVVPAQRASDEQPDILARPHRFPTEDYFRFREYVAGDDTRRIHWELTLKAGRMIVKTPDSKESSSKRVVVALDTWIPQAWLDHTNVIDDALDSLVEAWLAIAQKLVTDGEKVSLLLVCRAEDGSLLPEMIAAGENHALALDAGARAEWQSEIRIEHVLDHGVSATRRRQAGAQDEPAFDSAIVVTMSLAPPAQARAARETTWVYYNPADALGPPPRSMLHTWVDFDDSGRAPTRLEILKRLVLLPHPIGAEDNGMFARMKQLERRFEERAHRIALRAQVIATGERALGALMALPDAVYRLEHQAGHHRLIGLKGSARRPVARRSA